MNRVYFDNAASTPVLAEVSELICSTLQSHFGNPSSLHREGRTSRTIIEDARKSIATHLGASIGEIFFTSCGTEANNTILKGAVRDLGIERIITSPIEHPCVLQVVRALEESIKIEYVSLDDYGRVDLSDLQHRLKQPGKTLVSLMHINNEIGTINPIARIGQICRENNALFHSDTVQGIGFYSYNLQELPVDFISASAHKFHGPKGVGFMYINMEHSIQPHIHGGQQERNVRAGTENIPYIAGMSKALSLAHSEMDERRSLIESLKRHLKERLLSEMPEVRIVNAVDDICHYKIINLAVPLTTRSELAILNMDIAGFAISGGSACSSGAETDSHVYQTLFPNEDIKMLRVSFSHLNTLEEVDRFIDALKKNM